MLINSCSNTSETLFHRLQGLLSGNQLRDVVDTSLASLKPQFTQLSEKASEESTMVHTSLINIKQQLEYFDQLFQRLDKSEDQMEEQAKLLNERDSNVLELYSIIIIVTELLS